MKIGDKVAALDEDVEGMIVSLQDDLAIVEVDGFDMEFNIKELVVVKGEDLESQVFANKSSDTVIREKEMKDKPFLKPKATKKNQRPPMEVDLHAHQLRQSTKGLSKYQVLNLQLDSARGQLEFAIRKKIQRVVFIHGVGEGVLKMELKTLFGRYDNIKYYDADSKKYGFGATEVYIFQNP